MIPGKQPEAKAVSLVVSNNLTCVSCRLKLEVESGDFRSEVRPDSRMLTSRSEPHIQLNTFGPSLTRSLGSQSFH